MTHFGDFRCGWLGWLKYLGDLGCGLRETMDEHFLSLVSLYPLTNGSKSHVKCRYKQLASFNDMIWYDMICIVFFLQFRFVISWLDILFFGFQHITGNGWALITKKIPKRVFLIFFGHWVYHIPQDIRDVKGGLGFRCFRCFRCFRPPSPRPSLPLPLRLTVETEQLCCIQARRVLQDVEAIKFAVEHTFMQRNTSWEHDLRISKMILVYLLRQAHSFGWNLLDLNF